MKLLGSARKEVPVTGSIVLLVNKRGVQSLDRTLLFCSKLEVQDSDLAQSVFCGFTQCFHEIMR
jgi:hypothetical protein